MSAANRKVEDAKLEVQAAKLETKNAQKALAQEIGDIPLSKVISYLF